jgi:hypothetical protein
MGTTPALCHADLFEPYRVFLERSEFGPLVGVTAPLGAGGRPAGSGRSATCGVDDAGTVCGLA